MYTVNTRIGLSLFWLFLLSIGFTLPSWAQLPFDSTTIHQTLPNGFQYYLKKNSQSSPKQVDIRLLIKAGAFQEDEDQLGIAHFVEHMAFNGTKNFSQEDLFRAFRRLKIDLGPDVNATTSFEYTEYRLKSPSDTLHRLQESLDIFYDWATGLSFAPKEVEAEKGVILAEKREQNNPLAHFQDSLLKWFYAGTRLGKCHVLGDSATIARATPALLQRFFQDWYRPDLMALVIVGDFDERWLQQEIKARFGNLKMPATPRAWEKFAFQRKANRNVFKYSTPAFPGLSMGLNCTAPSLKILSSSADVQARAANNILLALVNQELSNLDIVRQHGIHCNLGWELDSYRNTSVHTLNIGAPPELFQTAIEKALGILLSTAKGSFSEASLLPIRQGLMQQSQLFKQRLDAGVDNGFHLQGLTQSFVYAQPFVRPQELEEHFMQAYQQVKKEDIVALAQQWLNPEGQSLVFVANPSAQALLPDSIQFWAAFDSIHAKSNVNPWANQEAYTKPWFTSPPEQRAQVLYKRHYGHDVTEIKYRNGVRVVLKPLQEDGKVYIDATSRGGYRQLKNEQLQAGKLLTQVAQLSGVEGFPHRALLQKTQVLGIQSELSLDQNAEKISSSCPKENLEDLLALLHLKFTKPQLEQAALDQVLGMEKRRIAVQMSDPYFFLQELHNRKEHPAAIEYWTPDAKALDQITLASLQEVYANRFFNSRDFTFTIVGEIDTQSIYPLLHQYLGSLPESGTPEVYTREDAKAFPLHALDTTILMLSAPKAVVEISYFGLKEHPKRGYYSLYLQEWQEVLAKKLFWELREKRGAVYSIHVTDQFIEEFQDYGFKIWFECAPNRVTELIGVTDSVVQANVHKTVLKEVGANLEAKFSHPRAYQQPQYDLSFWRDQLDKEPQLLKQMIDNEQNQEASASKVSKKTSRFDKPEQFYPALKKLITPQQRWKIVLLPQP